MTELSADYKALADYRPAHKVRFVTAASLFDGHDAAINIMRRILQGMGAEVIHLGHNRSVDEVVTAALQEDVQGIAITSYQGGHVEYFKYMIDLLKARGGANIRVFGGGGGVIVPSEIAELHGYGVKRIFSPEDGRRLGLAGMISEMMMRGDVDFAPQAPTALAPIGGTANVAAVLGRLIAELESGAAATVLREIARRGERPQASGHRHHRDRRRREVLLDRRAGPPPSPRPEGRAADRRHLRRPVAPEEGRRAARRSHPDERDRALGAIRGSGRGWPGPSRLHAQAGDARFRHLALGGAPRGGRGGQGGGLDLIMVESSGIGRGESRSFRSPTSPSTS